MALTFQDANFLKMIGSIEGVVSKLLAIAMLVVVLVSIYNLAVILATELSNPPVGFFSSTLIEVFGLFLNILIALEILENITAYLKEHVVQVELVIVTSLVAVARKIIIFDFSKSGGGELFGLGFAVLALSISYWIVKHVNGKQDH